MSELEKTRVSIPSSGVIVSVKLRRSAGSGKCVFIVGGRSSSVRSGTLARYKRHPGRPLGARQTFLNTNLCGAGLWPLLRRRVFVFLHAKDLYNKSAIALDGGSDADLQHGGLFAGRWWGEGRNEAAGAETGRMVVDGDVTDHQPKPSCPICQKRCQSSTSTSFLLGTPVPSESNKNAQRYVHRTRCPSLTDTFLLGRQRSDNVRSSPCARLSRVRRGQQRLSRSRRGLLCTTTPGTQKGRAP